MAHRKKLTPRIEIPQSELKNLIRKEVRAELFQGPMPHPDHLAKYEQLYPGASKLLFTLLQQQTEHRIVLEKSVVASNMITEKRGQWLAFSICMLVIAGGIVLSLFDKQIPGFASILGALGTIVTVFVIGKRKARKELSNKY